MLIPCKTKQRSFDVDSGLHFWRWQWFTSVYEWKMWHNQSVQMEFWNINIFWTKTYRYDVHIYRHLFVLNQTPLAICMMPLPIHHLWMVQEQICGIAWLNRLSADIYVIAQCLIEKNRGMRGVYPFFLQATHFFGQACLS